MRKFKRDQFPVRVRRAALDLARRGPCALCGLYDLTAPRLLRYARALTCSPEDAEDAVQAAMIRITLKPRVLAEARYPWAYFLRIVRNEAITLVRRRKPTLPLASHSVPETAPQSSLEDDETRQRVRRAVRRLPPPQAEVVVLHIWEEMTFLEIAEVTEESPNTVASRYRYALEKLTRALHEFDVESAPESSQWSPSASRGPLGTTRP